MLGAAIKNSTASAKTRLVTNNTIADEADAHFLGRYEVRIDDALKVGKKHY